MGGAWDSSRRGTEGQQGFFSGFWEGLNGGDGCATLNLQEAIDLRPLNGRIDV